MLEATALVLSLTATFVPQAPPRDTTLCGRIVTPLCEGAPAVAVWATDASGAVLARATTDGEGFYLLQRLPADELRLHARGDGLAEASLVVAPTGRHRAASLQLEAGRELRGVVTMPDGSAAVGADVVAFDSENLRPGSSRSWAQHAVTDAEGKWRLAAAPLRPLLVRAFVPGHAIAEVSVARAQDTEVAARIPETRLYERQVRLDGMPTDLRVVLHNDPNGRYERAAMVWPARMTSVVVAADGTATMWPLPVSHDLRIEAPGHRCYPLLVLCKPGDSANQRFALSPAPAALREASTQLRGQIVDELGAPLGGQVLVGATDTRRGPTCVSAPDGSFELTVPVREKVLCRIGLLSPDRRLGGADCELGSDGIMWRSVAADPNTPIRLDAAPAVALHCLVRTDDGAALVTTAIELTWHGAAQGREVTVYSATDRTGRLHLDGLVPGRFQVMATRADGLQLRHSLSVSTDEQRTELVLPLPASGEVTGVVLDPDGKPVSSALFSMGHLRDNGRQAPRRVGRLDNDSVRNIVCDRDGRFRIPDVAAGDWALKSGHDALGLLIAAPDHLITVEAGRSNEVRFVMPK